MRRKLVRQGQNALTVTVPAKWTQEMQLEAGDEVEITRLETDLLITTKAQVKEKEIELEIKSDDQYLIKGTIKTLYRLGYDIIKIKFENKKQLKTIINTIENELLGFEVVHEEENLIVLESLTEPSDKKHNLLLKKIFQIAKQTFEIIITDLKNKKFESIDEITKLTRKSDQYDSFCRRNISKKRFSEEKINYYWELYQRLLLIQYSLLHTYQLLDKEKPTEVNNQIWEVFTELEQYYNTIYTIFSQNKTELLEELNEKIVNFRFKKIHELMKKTNGTETIILYYCGELTRRFNLCTLPLVAILTT
ncbi:phosphate uptake regulator PhoU [Candidatus Woesearchaeota archaeon]|jgi:phosphate uptake regulator|nr:phosphate uptake regulator PhoU [Candidatus Woesearchaeota archaeon]MBT6519850.1 phosphate uptake regulator PhoU [Candidatus Woesearchaeota archaeon]MBT7367142.1 phosphate uptake regulator PhoU [Candidatus Woesearchaeota archaeon]